MIITVLTKFPGFMASGFKKWSHLSKKLHFKAIGEDILFIYMPDSIKVR